MWKDVPTNKTYAEVWAEKDYQARGDWLRERVQETDKKIYAFAGTKDGDKERLLKAIGQPGCAVTRLENMPPRINGIYLLIDLKLMLRAAEVEVAEQVTDTELDRLAAYGRAEWAVLADPALVLA